MYKISFQKNIHNTLKTLFVWVSKTAHLVSFISLGSDLEFGFTFYQDWVLSRVQHRYGMDFETSAISYQIRYQH